MNTLSGCGKSVFPVQHSPSGWKPRLISRQLRHEWNSCLPKTGVKSEFFRSLLWHSVSGRRNLRPAPRHERQVVAPDINPHCREHQNQADPETPIVMRALPIRNVAVMAFTQGVRVFGIVQCSLQFKERYRKGSALPENMAGIRVSGCPRHDLDADHGKRRL